MCVFLSLLFVPTSAQGADDQQPEEKVCHEVADVYSVVVTCEFNGQSLAAAKRATPAAKWVIYQLCKDGTSGEAEACSNPRACTLDGTTGTLYAVFKDGVRVGTACLTASEAVADDPPIRVLVIRAFENLDWAPSVLTIQPPAGRTLVNLETNFFTTNTQYSDRAVTLQGQNVVVSAKPIAYRWHFGDGTRTTTTSPGAPYPDLDVAHVYETTDKVLVSVDTQYGAASFTVNGGPPEQIPSTIWINGEDQDLEVVEALPQLIVR
jgi:hypothetical protein